VTRELEPWGLVIEYLDFDRHPRSVEEHAEEIERRVLRAIGKEYKPSTTEAISRLGSLCQEQSQSIFVLVDGVEAILGTQVEVGDVERVIEHLFDPRLLRIPGLHFKFFLPASLADRLNSYHVFQRGAIPFNILHVRWTEARLRRLLETRIGQVCKEAPTLVSISADEHGQPFDLDGAVTQLALEQPGAPRRLLRLVNEVIRVHARSEADVEKFRLTRSDLNAAWRSLTLPERAPRLTSEDYLRAADRLGQIFERLGRKEARLDFSIWNRSLREAISSEEEAIIQLDRLARQWLGKSFLELALETAE